MIKIKLKIPESQKFEKEGEWFKEMINHYIPFQLPYHEDYEVMSNSYKVVNNDLSGFRSQLQAFCNPLGVNTGEIEEEVLPYPELRNKVNILKGEMLSRRDTYHVMLLSSKAIKEKDEQLLNAIKESVDEKTAIDIQKMELQMQGMSPEEIEKFTADLRTKNEPEDLVTTNFMSDSEIFYNTAIRYCEYNQDLQSKKADSFEDVVVTDREFIYSGWRYGKPYLEVRNPLTTGFHKNPNERYVQHSDWVWHTKAITITEAIEMYDLTEEQINLLGVSITKGLSHKHNVMGGSAESVWDHSIKQMQMAQLNQNISNDKTKGLNQSPLNALRAYTDLVWETHFEFKAFKELIFLSYRDDYNKQVIIPLSSDFKIPKTAKKEKKLNRFDIETTFYTWFDKTLGKEFTAERIWIPRKYEIVRLGGSVYPVFREVPYQYTNVEDPYSTFTLSTFGAIFNARNTHSVSLIQHALQPYFQYLYIKHVQNKELSKYQGFIQDIDVEQIPDQLGQDLYGNEIRDKVASWLATLKKTNRNFYAGSQTTLGGLPPSTRSPGSSSHMIGTAIELMNLQQLLELVKREISMAMGISPQRESNFQSGSNVSDNQQAITQSYAITEPYFFMHSQIWKAAVNDWLINFRTFCQTQFEVHNLKDLSFQFWLPDNTQQVLKVTPKHLSHADIGLLLTNSTVNQKYADLMMQQVQAFAQNAGEGVSAVSQILMDIVMGASPAEIHKRIMIQENKIHQRAMEMQKAQQDAQAQMLEREIENREDIQKAQVELALIKETERRVTEIQKATISALGFAENSDVDNDGTPDVIELMDHDLKSKKLDLEIKKQKEDVRLKEEKLSIDRIKVNKPTSSK